MRSKTSSARASSYATTRETRLDPKRGAGVRCGAQLWRYATAGLVSNGLGYAFYLLLTYGGVGSKMAMTVLYATAAMFAFFANRTLTFAYSGSTLSSGFRFVLVQAAGYLINLAILAMMADMRGYPHQLAQAVAIVVVAAFLFLSLKFFVFRMKTRSSGLQ